MGDGLRDRLKLPVLVRAPDIGRGEANRAIRIDRAERFSVPRSVDQIVRFQLCLHLRHTELLFRFPQKLLFLHCFFFVHEFLHSQRPIWTSG